MRTEDKQPESIIDSFNSYGCTFKYVRSVEIHVGDKFPSTEN